MSKRTTSFSQKKAKEVLIQSSTLFLYQVVQSLEAVKEDKNSSSKKELEEALLADDDIKPVKTNHHSNYTPRKYSTPNPKMQKKSQNRISYEHRRGPKF